LHRQLVEISEAMLAEIRSGLTSSSGPAVIEGIATAFALCERVPDTHALELPKVAIVAPQRADAVLPYQRDEMCVGNEIPPHNGTRRDRAVDLPKVVTLTQGTSVRKP
jgi:hypothetical protein